jgi:hypothetical protein
MAAPINPVKIEMDALCHSILGNKSICATEKVSKRSWCLKNGKSNGRGESFDGQVFDIIVDQPKKDPIYYGPLLSFAILKCQIGKGTKQDDPECYVFLVMTEDRFSQVTLLPDMFSLNLVEGIFDGVVRVMRVEGLRNVKGTIILDASWLQLSLNWMHETLIAIVRTKYQSTTGIEWRSPIKVISSRQRSGAPSSSRGHSDQEQPPAGVPNACLRHSYHRHNRIRLPTL